MTVGNFCPDWGYANPFDCPAKCFHNLTKLEEPRCQAFAEKRWMSTTEQLCNIRMPCYEWEFTDSDQEIADACAVPLT
jgi:hypothetical protein